MKVVIVGFDMKKENSVYYSKFEISYFSMATRDNYEFEEKLGKRMKYGYKKGARYFSVRVIE